MKPDYIEQDVVMTKDDQLVVLHDHYLDRVTDVADRFQIAHEQMAAIMRLTLRLLRSNH